MADVNLREFITDALKPLLPPSWTLIPYPRNIDVITKPVAMLKLQTVKRTEAAPQGARTLSYILTVIEPKSDPKAGQDSLDDELIDLLNAIDQLNNVVWKTAERVSFGDPNEPGLPAYDITLEISITKEA